MIKRHVLVLEEVHSARQSYSEILTNMGLYVTAAIDGNDLALKGVSGEYPLLIVSLKALGSAVYDIISNIKSEKPETEILVLSDEASVESAVSVMKCGALDFVIKPLDSSKLKIYIDRVFGQEAKTTAAEPKKRTRIVTNDQSMKRLIDMIHQVADSTASVLIQGESGTGKEMFARYIHEHSNRKNGPFIAVNCAALPEALLESELFGHEKGAFTGAATRKAGKFELADGGTILLDEITEMQLHLQSKLLRVIQEREVDRVGGTAPVKINVRVLATTNRDVKGSIDNGEFREDLYYRLNVIPVKIPSLRNRPGDIKLLAEYFIDKFNNLDGRNVKCLTDGALSKLESLTFSGNVREMENIIHRAVLLCDGESIKEHDLLIDESPLSPQVEPSSPSSLPGELMSAPLKEVEKKMIFHTLDKTEGNRTHAAKLLGISVRTLRNKLNEYKESTGT